MTDTHAATTGAANPVRYEDVADAFASMTQEVFEINDANGWFEKDRPFAEDIALLHSEVSEMLEAYRDWALEDATNLAAAKALGVSIEEIEAARPEKLRKPEGVGAEAADVLIRLLDTCRRSGVNLAAEYVRKAEYNRTRGYRHGGKLI